MKVTMLLCDHAAVAEGKLYISGGGWSVTGPTPSPFGIAILFGVPWDQANRDHHMRLFLERQDGEPVLQTNELGQTEPIEISGAFQVGRPPFLMPGTALDLPVAINHGPLPLEPDQRYRWVLEIDEHREDDWVLPFTVRAAPKAPPS